MEVALAPLDGKTVSIYKTIKREAFNKKDYSQLCSIQYKKYPFFLNYHLSFVCVLGSNSFLLFPIILSHLILISFLVIFQPFTFHINSSLKLLLSLFFFSEFSFFDKTQKH